MSSNIQSAFATRRIEFRLVTLGLLSTLFSVSVVNGQGQDEQRKASELVGLLQSDDPQLDELAKQISDAIPQESNFRIVANQAFAMILIRSQRFRDAWKLVESSTSSADATNTKLRLWLAIEADAGQLAEPAFKSLVLMALDSNLPEADRVDLCKFLGGVIGLLEACPKPCIPSTTIGKGVTALQAIDRIAVVESFNKSREASQEWAKEILDRNLQFEKLGLEKSQERLQSLEEEMKLTVDERIEDRRGTKLVGDKKKEVAGHQSELKKKRAFFEGQLKIQTEGKPIEPRPPVRPRKPGTVYRTVYDVDPKTGNRTSKKEEDRFATRQAERDYERELRDYEDRMANYKREFQSYLQLFEVWKVKDQTRRSEIRTTIKGVDEEIEAEKKALVALGQEGKEALNQSKETEKEIKDLERSLMIARIVLVKLKAKDTKPLIRPSSFALIDFDIEKIRFEKRIRSL